LLDSLLQESKMRRSDCQTGALVFTATLVTYVVFFTGTGQNRTSETSSLFETANEEGADFVVEKSSWLKDIGLPGFKKSAVNEVTDVALPPVYPYACVRQFLKTRGDKNWIMCAKEPEEYISSIIYESGIYDAGISTLIANMTEKYPGGLFLDIGANMGAFTVQIASDKYRVMAVDPSAYNHAIIRKSLELGGTQKYVRQILNAVSDEKMSLYPWNQNNPTNEGGLVWLSEEDKLGFGKDIPAEQLGAPTQSVTFKELLDIIEEDTIIIKLDVEGAECKVLSNYLNSDEHKTKYIPYIFLEWTHCANNHYDLCPDIDRLIEGFRKSGFRPVALGVAGTASEELSTENHKNWMDMLWVHRDAIV